MYCVGSAQNVPPNRGTNGHFSKPDLIGLKVHQRVNAAEITRRERHAKEVYPFDLKANIEELNGPPSLKRTVYQKEFPEGIPVVHRLHGVIGFAPKKIYVLSSRSRLIAVGIEYAAITSVIWGVIWGNRYVAGITDGV
jgi:hypothetical protein